MSHRAIACMLILGWGTGLAAADGRVLLSASGRVEPASEERSLAFPVPGRLTRMHVEEGQEVKAGDLLAELENDEEKAAVKLADAEVLLSSADADRAAAELQKITNGARAEERAMAKAEVSEAKARLDRLRNGARPEEIALAAAQHQRQKAERENAARLVARLTQLREGEVKAASLEEMENALDRLRVAEAAEAEAKANLDLVSGRTRDEDLAIAEAKHQAAQAASDLVCGETRAEDVAMAQAALAAAKARQEAARARQAMAQASLAKTVLCAPIAGTVLKVFMREGEQSLPAAPRPVLTLGDLSALMSRAEVDETDIAKVKTGQGISAKAVGMGQTEFRGKVTRVGASMGRKRLFSENPHEKIDTQILEVMIRLDERPTLPVGLRLDIYFLRE